MHSGRPIDGGSSANRSFSDKNWSEYSNREKVGVAAGVIFIGIPYSILYKTPCKILKWTYHTAVPKAGKAIEYIAKKILMPCLEFVWRKGVVPIGRGLRTVTVFTGRQLLRCIRSIYHIGHKILSSAWYQMIKPIGRTLFAVLKTIGRNVSHFFRSYIYKLVLAPLGRTIKKIVIWTWDKTCSLLAGIRDCAQTILSWVHGNMLAPLAALFRKAITFTGNALSSLYNKLTRLFTKIFTKLYQHVLVPFGSALKTITVWTYKNLIVKGWNFITTIVGQTFRFLQKHVYHGFIKPVAVWTWRVFYDFLLLPCFNR